MSAPFLIPFNFQPFAVQVISGSFTVAAGEYCQVTANIEGSATVTINGSTALRGTANGVLSGSTLQVVTSSNNALLTTPTSGTNAAAFSQITDEKVLIATFWVPTGTVINGTGNWRAIVTRYKNIT